MDFDDDDDDAGIDTSRLDHRRGWAGGQAGADWKVTAVASSAQAGRAAHGSAPERQKWFETGRSSEAKTSCVTFRGSI